MFDQVDFTRINNNKFCSILNSLFDSEPNNGMSRSSVTSDRNNTGCMEEIFNIVCLSSAPECGSQTGYRWGVSNPGTIIYIICSQCRPGKLLGDIVIFVSGPRGRDDGHLFRFIAC